MFKKYIPTIEIELSFTQESDNVHNLNLFLAFEYKGKTINLNWLVKHNRSGLVNSIFKKDDESSLIKVFERINKIDQQYGEIK